MRTTGMGDAAFHARMLADQQDRFAREAAGTRTAELQQDVDHLRLVVSALWSLLAEREGLTLEQLVARIDEIDERDGVRDGRYRSRPRTCPACRALVPPERATCQMCGAAAPGGDPFV